MKTGARVRIENLTKKYGDITALYKANLAAEPGRVTVIAGPSGSGKSTLLRLIAGLETPDEGKIYFDDKDVTRLPPWERRSVMLSQRPVLLPHLTILENIVLAAESQGLTREEAMDEAHRIASYLGIMNILDRRPGTLSGGQLQRASLAAVISARPRVLLLDEPFAHLDLPLRESFRRLVKDIARRQGITVIQVTHDQDEALELADNLVVLIDGRVIDAGDPLRVYYNPSSLEVAAFLGHNIVCESLISWKKGIPASFPPEAVTVGEGPYTGTLTYVGSRKHYTVLYIRVHNTTLKAVVQGVKRFDTGGRITFNIDGSMVKVWSERDDCKSINTAHAV